MSVLSVDIEKGVHGERAVVECVTPVQQPRALGDPVPLGLCSFALTTFVLSLINLQVHGVTVPNVVVGLTLFYGGVAQFSSGLWGFAVGNTFAGTVFASYGTFWLSYSAILIPSFGIATAYGDNVAELHTAISFFLFGWFILTTLMLIVVLRHSVAFIFVFTVLDLTFLTLAVGEYLISTPWIKAGGVCGLLAASSAWYCALSLLLNKENSYFQLPLVLLT